MLPIRHEPFPLESRLSRFWRAKIEANRARDADTTRRLRELGWEVIRVWSHEDPVEAALHIQVVVESRKPESK